MSNQSNLKRNGGQRPRSMKPKHASKSGNSVARLERRIILIEKSIIETKYFDDLVSTTFSTTGAANTLNNLAQGDSVITRNGNKIFVEKIDLKYSVVCNTALVGPVNCRIMLLRDQMPQGQTNSLSIAGSQTILGANGVLDNSIIVSNPHLMPLALEMKDRYKVLVDDTFVINPYSPDVFSITNNTSATATMTATNVLDRTVQRLHPNIKVGMRSIFQDGTANISSLLEGSLVLLAFCDQSGNLPSIVAGTRTYFKDA